MRPGSGIDDSAAALAVAKRNAKRPGPRGSAGFRPAALGRGLAGPFDGSSATALRRRGGWPGLQPEIRDFEPRAALLAGPDGLAVYRALAPDCARLLAPHGLCALEIGYGQGDAVTAILGRRGLRVTGRRAISPVSSAASSRAMTPASPA